MSVSSYDGLRVPRDVRGAFPHGRGRADHDREGQCILPDMLRFSFVMGRLSAASLIESQSCPWEQTLYVNQLRLSRTAKSDSAFASSTSAVSPMPWRGLFAFQRLIMHPMRSNSTGPVTLGISLSPSPADDDVILCLGFASHTPFVAMQMHLTSRGLRTRRRGEARDAERLPLSMHRTKDAA
ncbi:hypothetical protein BV25DRAFT_1830640 [Artomyces pyxidatus]|uniref:Uncharacterized protein n=1 Tax=Artomyces pyxidatus TaxID=48021 RepID=A0ACB8SN97_9AGAM|nr:hypothetical protein BV25DRAFT_1830640 [Artomyces pyxidatus]